MSRASLADTGEPGLEATLRLDRAVGQLRLQCPELSSGLPWWRWQKAAVAGLLMAGVFAFWWGFETVMLAVLAAPILCATLLKIYAMACGYSVVPVEQLDRHDANDQNVVVLNEILPRYTVLVPLFREPDVAVDLIGALAALDYPPDRLQILVILEEQDDITRTAFAMIPMPSHFEIVTVPPGQPQTKPRALNFALQHAAGDFVVVYDAEDCPAPDQLRIAVAAFARSKETACLQAKLSIYNADASWLTRQFALEYAALFDWILPALQRAQLPIPLSGTSNHFRREVLIAAGGWDPFNVTEDADLGMRFARFSHKVEVIATSTVEEAPATFANWLPQRTRWLKGWMQTYAVHTRQPWSLYRQLGLRGFLGFHILFGAMLVSALVHPWFYVAAAYDAYAGRLFSVPRDGLGAALWWIGALNLVTGYVAGAALAAMAAVRFGKRAWIGSLPLLPVYWLLVSLAAYRALGQLFWAPHRWEKTTHSGRRLPTGPP